MFVGFLRRCKRERGALIAVYRGFPETIRICSRFIRRHCLGSGFPGSRFGRCVARSGPPRLRADADGIPAHKHTPQTGLDFRIGLPSRESTRFPADLLDGNSRLAGASRRIWRHRDGRLGDTSALAGHHRRSASCGRRRHRPLFIDP
jgi:hypothetical protein